MAPVIRPFEPRDQEAVVALSLRAWEPVFASLERVLGESGVFAHLYPDWRAGQRRAVLAACRADGMRVWVAEVTEPTGPTGPTGPAGVVGFVAALLHRDGGVGEVHMVAVDPDHQRRGTGSLLTGRAQRWFRDEGMAVAVVETGGDPGHAPARRTYERAGFVRLPVARYFRKL